MTANKAIMSWREPTAFVRKKLTIFKIVISLLVTFMISFLLLTIITNPNTNDPFHLKLVLESMVTTGVLFAINWHRPGALVRLEKDQITWRYGKKRKFSYYTEIQKCTVEYQHFKGNGFAVLKFEQNEPKQLSKFRVYRPIIEAAVPAEVNLEEVLVFLRSNGVPVFA